MNCVDVLQKRGYCLKGYSLDTIFYLNENSIQNGDQCIPWFWFLEARYG